MIGYWGMGGKDGVSKIWPIRGDRISETFAPLNEEQFAQLQKLMKTGSEQPIHNSTNAVSNGAR